MAFVEVKVTFNQSFYDKLNESTFRYAAEETVKEVTNELKEECETQCPVRTGNLRDGHYTIVNGLEGSVANNVEYAPYVVFGTSRQSANNYPQRAMSAIAGRGIATEIFYKNYNSRIGQ